VTAVELAEPETIPDACDLLARHAGEAKIIAGGTAVVLMMRQGLIRPGLLVSLNRIPQMSSIDAGDGHVRIGARCTLADIASSDLIRSLTPALARASQMVGNIRVRNAATIAGNLAEADYASDIPAVLTCLGAECTVRDPDGERRVGVDELITGFYSTALSPEEIITQIDVPVTTQRPSTYLKYVSRSSEDRPCVGVSALASIRNGTLDELRVVVGAVAPRPVLLRDVCSAAAGRKLDDSTIQEVADGYADGIDPLDDHRGSAWYRREMIRVFVNRALRELGAGNA
jgi:aerobic carbon-monoxide dehydrogenase medium subunit